MSQPPWEEVEVPRGSFIGWGTYVGQYVTGKVLSYDPTGGTDFNDNICPRLDVELIEPAASFDKEGNRRDHAAGEFVVLNCGLANLKRAVAAAQLNIGDLVKITLESFEKVDKGTVKIFGIKVARGAGRNAQPAAQQQPAQQFGQAPAGPPPQQPPAQQFGQQQPAAQPAQQFGQAPAPAATPPADPWGAAPTPPPGSEPPF